MTHRPCTFPESAGVALEWSCRCILCACSHPGSACLALLADAVNRMPETGSCSSLAAVIFCRGGARLQGPGLRCMARRQEQLQGGICSFLWMAVSRSPFLQAPRPLVRWVALHVVSILVTSIMLSIGHAMPGWLAAEYGVSRWIVHKGCFTTHETRIDQDALMLGRGCMRRST